MFYEFRLNCITTETVLKNYADSLKNIATLNQVNIIFFIQEFLKNYKNYKKLNGL